MTTVEMKRNFKNKSGYTRYLMTEIPTDNPKGRIKFKFSFCYPANETGKFIEYVQNTYDMTKEEANSMFLKLKKQGFDYKITK